MRQLSRLKKAQKQFTNFVSGAELHGSFSVMGGAELGQAFPEKPE
jgi:hypothetical protein